MAVGALKHDHHVLLIGLGATPEVAQIVVDKTIPQAIRAGLGLESTVSMNGAVSGYTPNTRSATERSPL